MGGGPVGGFCGPGFGGPAGGFLSLSSSSGLPLLLLPLKPPPGPPKPAPGPQKPPPGPPPHENYEPLPTSIEFFCTGPKKRQKNILGNFFTNFPGAILNEKFRLPGK